MKPKPVKCQTKNTFRYESFNERIAKISVDVIHRIGKTSETPEDADTFFYEGFTKWTTLNCTLHFEDFKNEISGQFQSFPQLLHHKAKIISILKKHLQISDSLALLPLLDLVVQLARDLQYDFYPEFPDFFRIIISLLKIHDPEILEATFTALSYIFKFLWRYMVKDIKNVFSLYSELLVSDRKEHIRNFASESFAFLMRKVKDPDDVFNFLFLQSKIKPKLISGIGQLLFEMLKGVRQQFHSCLGKILPILLKKLQLTNNDDEENQLPLDLIEKILSHTMAAMADYVLKDFCAPVWDIFLITIKSSYEDYNQQTSENKMASADYLHRLLKILTIWLHYKNGVLIINVDQIVLTLVTLLNESNFPADVAAAIFKMASLLLITETVELTMEQISRTVKMVFKTNYNFQLIFEFARSLFRRNMFEKDILPPLLIYCQSCMTRDDNEAKRAALHIMCELIVHQRPIPFNALELQQEPYPLDFVPAINKFCKDSSVLSFPSYVLSLLTLNSKNDFEDCCLLASIWAALVILPFIKPFNADKACQKLKKIYHRLHKYVKETSKHKDAVLSLMSQSQIVLIQLMPAEEFFEEFPLKFIEELVKFNPTNVFTLRTADFYFTHAASSQQHQLLTEDVLKRLIDFMKENLSSPYHQIRIHTVHMLSLFSVSLPILQEKIVEQIGVFKICLKAELVTISFHTYRDKLVHLQKLSYDLVQSNMPYGSYEDVPLRYLLGVLYINFQLFWQPVIKLIESYARGMKPNAFWKIFGHQLEKTAIATEMEVNGVASQESSNFITTDNLNNLVVLFSEQSASLASRRERVDYFNYRLWLWKAISNFADIAETKNKDIVNLLLRFIRNEFYSSDLCVAPSQNLLKHSDELELDDDHNESDIDDDEEGKNKIKQASKPDKKGRKRPTIKTLCVYLTVFSKFKAPKSIFNESELKEFYFEFLSYRNEEVQKLALQCILAYNSKNLNPYKDNFARIINQKTFRSELVLFSIDQDQSVILEEDRPDVIAILMRLLYGKMFAKMSKRTSSKYPITVRKAIVLGFLAGCTQDELGIFMDMIFAPFKMFLSDDIFCTVKSLIHDADLQNVIPLRKQQSTLSTLNVIFLKLGHLIERYLPWLLHIVLCFLAILTRILNQRELIHPHHLKRLKILRTLCLNRITQFFESFEEYNFTSNEIDAIFEVAVWPQLDRLSFEGVYSPTAMLKLFHNWSSNPRYFGLLAKQHPSQMGTTPLSTMFILLNIPSAKRSVTNMVISIIDNLLTLSDFEATETLKVITANNVLPVSTIPESQYSKEPPNYGTLLLLPHIPNILQYLIKRVKVNKSHALLDENLNILSRLNEYVTDPDQCTNLVKLILPFLTRPVNRTEEAECNMLYILANLIRQASNASQFIRPVSKMFSRLIRPSARTGAVTILKAIAEKCKETQLLADIADQLNSWDAKRMEQPDYAVRLDAFKLINQTVKNFELVDVDFLLLVTHNCFFFIKSSEDLSLRDNASFSLKTIIDKLSQEPFNQSEAFKIIVLDNVLSEIKKGIILTNDAVRHEFITLLATIVHSSSQHPRLKGLVPLTDNDLEIDFFENIKHIQMSRRGKALNRIVWLCKKKALNPDVLLNFVLPLVKVFLFNEAYKKGHLNFLVDNAVECVGAICYCLPWSCYQGILIDYLNILTKEKEHQKTVIKLIRKILDVFHFDLSQSQCVNKIMKEAKTKVKSKKGAEEENEADEVHETSDEPSLEETPDDKKLEPENQAGETNIEKSILSPEQATRIHNEILESILPQLYKCLTQKRKIDDAHKTNRRFFEEDEHILRVPIALAMIHLLQQLPQGTLESNLPSILLKVCQMLKSRSDPIREKTRKILRDIMKVLGPRYFPYVLKELHFALRRGFQLHVLLFTAHGLLKELKSSLKPGALDTCIHLLSYICNEELFGQVGEEKEVEKITSKLFEAKKIKSYDIYKMVASVVTEISLPKLVLPFKEILENTRSHKVATKVQNALKYIREGLGQNESINEKTLLIFIHGLTTEGIPLLNLKTKKQVDVKASIKPIKTDCYLLQPEPKRTGPKPVTNSKTNMHILIDFGLQLLLFVIKHRIHNKEHLEMLDPYIEILVELLDSKHVRLIISSLRCLGKMLKLPLLSLEKCISQVSNSLFILLRTYSKIGAGHGDNYELLNSCFKTVTVLVKDVKYHVIDEDQLKVLLTFAEQDLHDHTRQATAFMLLQAIISRKLIAPEIPEIMSTLKEMCITSEIKGTRQKCHSVIIKFLLEYPIGKKLQSYLEFFIMQLTYEIESGRMAALEMLISMYSSFPQELLEKYAGMFFVPMAVQIINDESASCREANSAAIKILLSKIRNNTRDTLFTITTLWFQDRKLLHRRLAAQVSSLFLDIEDFNFERHLENIFQLIQVQLEPGRYMDKPDDTYERKLDHHLFACLSLLIKIFTKCHVIRNSKWQEVMNDIWTHLNEHLLHPHVWVRLTAAQLFGLLFVAWTPEDLIRESNNTNKSTDFLLDDLPKKLKELSCTFLDQLKSYQLKEDLATQVTKNLVYIAKIVRLLKLDKDTQEEDEDEEKEKEDEVEGEEISAPEMNKNDHQADVVSISMKWLIRRMCREAMFESIKNPQAVIKRCAVFRWLGAVATDLGSENLPQYLELMLVPIHRELSDTTGGTEKELKILANEVKELLQKIVSVEVFTSVYSTIQTKVSVKRMGRKRTRTAEAVTNPQKFALKKIKKQQNKKTSRKRKKEAIKLRKTKKRKLQDFAVLKPR